MTALSNSPVLEAIRNRRAVRNFDPAHQLTEPEILALLEEARLSPTAFNLQQFRFLVVSDPAQRRKLREASWDQPQVTDASALIVLCADIKAWEKDPEQCWTTAPAEIRDLYVGKLIPEFYSGRPQLQRDEGVRSCGLAAYALMMAAEACGLQSCPMDGFDFDQVAEIINLPADHIVVMYVAIGRELAAPGPRLPLLPLQALVAFNRFGPEK
ncbi:nitroreductase family protein [Oecophyllibacter saccharovorans]|uniref:nitroreductase family protein n=1 Tax=Oecophyllibacter saccharovorans TaxID=2558360 RepID=UPI001166E17B|nr:nitroreductase family protein [Oecophyllibacter saccharovorans]TPW34904.1 nitroreductase family protein [Oecophyllibacter saccharovorans]